MIIELQDCPHRGFAFGRGDQRDRFAETAERRQGLASETKAADGGEVVKLGQLGGVVLERDSVVVFGGDAGAVVNNLNGRDAIVFEANLCATVSRMRE